MCISAQVKTHLHSSLASSSALFHAISRHLKSHLSLRSVLTRSSSSLSSLRNPMQYMVASFSLVQAKTWPCQFSVLLQMMFFICPCPVLSFILLFVHLSRHDTCIILLQPPMMRRL